MTKKITTNNGHIFEIDGPLSAGSNVNIKVYAAEGYEFVGWNDGVTDNPRNITVTECGVNYLGVFEKIDEECSKYSIYNSLIQLIGCDVSDYQASDIDCDGIMDMLNNIIGVC